MFPGFWFDWGGEMTKKHEIHHITDMLKLSEDEFHRVLPDLAVWWSMAKALSDIEGVTNTGFVWVDDGVVGVDHCKITDPDTGEVTIHPVKTEN